MALIEQALRAMRSRGGVTYDHHICLFRNDADCTCGRTFEQAIRSKSDRFILELT